MPKTIEEAPTPPKDVGNQFLLNPPSDKIRHRTDEEREEEFVIEWQRERLFSRDHSRHKKLQ
jgi:hypothetical protein